MKNDKEWRVAKYIALKIKRNYNTVRTYLPKLVKKGDLICNKNKGIKYYKIYQPSESTPSAQPTQFNSIHGLTLYAEISTPIPLGGTFKPFKCGTLTPFINGSNDISTHGKIEVGASEQSVVQKIMAHFFGDHNANWYKYDVQFPNTARGKSSTSLSGYWEFKGRSIKFQIAWGDQTKSQGANLTFWINASNSPLDQAGFEWLKHEVLKSFQIDLLAHDPPVMLRQIGIGVDTPRGYCIQANSVNMRFKVFEDTFLEYYDKDDVDGEDVLRNCLHISPQDKALKDFLSLVQGGIEISEIAEAQKWNTQALNYQSKALTKLIEHINQLIQQNNLIYGNLLKKNTKTQCNEDFGYF